MTNRLQKIQSRHPDHKMGRIHLNPRPRRRRATFPAQAGEMAVEGARPASVYLVARRPLLSEHPPLWRWLARFVYQQIGWCPDFGIEYQGVFKSEAEARYAASAPGFFYMELPLDASLPIGPCQYGVHDFPHSEASAEYRKRQLPFDAVPRKELKRLREKIRDTDGIVERFRAKTA